LEAAKLFLQNKGILPSKIRLVKDTPTCLKDLLNIDEHIQQGLSPVLKNTGLYAVHTVLPLS
jgi:hypothetical protein